MNKSNIITSKKFVDIADIIFSQVITVKDFSKFKNKNQITVFDRNEEFIIYQTKNLGIEDNSIIFSTSFMIKDLFKLLNKEKRLKRLILVTHQGDDLIDKKLFSLKPKSISKWYSTNVNYKNESLIPIPLGIANYNLRNLNELQFIGKENFTFFERKQNLLYLNFQKNTNNKERDGIYENFEKKKWVEIDLPDKDLKDYHKKLENSSFVLCPWGNGVDTHRIWETLYSGSIPITKFHYSLSTLHNLPILFINDYSEITPNLLESFLKNNYKTKFNYEKLNFNFWKTQILNIQNNVDRNIYYIVNNKSNKLFKTNKLLERYFKKLKFYFRKLKKLLNLFFLN